MSFRIIFKPLNQAPGTKPRTVTKETAAEAWMLVQQLQASNEKMEIRNEAGHLIDWVELRAMAEKRMD